MVKNLLRVVYPLRANYVWLHYYTFKDYAVLSQVQPVYHQEVVGLIPAWQHSFTEIDHKIISIVIRSLPLIQKGQLSVSGERMCTNIGQMPGELSLSR